jgi:hypothetical protein
LNRSGLVLLVCQQDISAQGLFAFMQHPDLLLIQFRPFPLIVGHLSSFILAHPLIP